MSRFARWSIRRKLILVILVVSLSAIGVSATLTLVLEIRHNRTELARELATLAQLLGNRSTAALAFEDDASARENLASLSTLPHVRRACLYGDRGQLFADYRSTGARDCAPTDPTTLASPTFEADTVLIREDIRVEQQRVGSILLESTLRPLGERLSTQLAARIATVGLAVALSLLLALRLQRLISTPLLRIRDVAAAVMASRDFTLRAPRLSDDEVGELAETFNRMLETIEAQNLSLQQLNQDLEARVEARTHELVESKQQVVDTLESLRRTQDELVRREKLASLGALVAGVAHELNTPLGNALIVANTMTEDVDGLQRSINEHRLRRSDLDEFLTKLGRANELTVRNLRRAAELIAHFKQVAVDQTSEMRRPFDLRSCTLEVIETLKPQFRHTPHRIDCLIEAGLAMDSYPGPLGQVLTNLVMNSLLHGFSDGRAGWIRIDGRRLGSGEIELEISDNGCGISAEHLSRIFDPFFTTRFGQGGSGLGLHIVYNTVVQTLGGSIAVTSAPSEGARFTLRLPCTAPANAAPVVLRVA